jgi:hypothetical protein
VLAASQTGVFSLSPSRCLVTPCILVRKYFTDQSDSDIQHHRSPFSFTTAHIEFSPMPNAAFSAYVIVLNTRFVVFRHFFENERPRWKFASVYL